MKKILFFLVPVLLLLVLFKKQFPAISISTNTNKEKREKVFYGNELVEDTDQIEDYADKTKEILSKLDKKESEFKSRQDYLAEIVKITNNELEKNKKSEKTMYLISEMLERVSNFDCYKMLNSEMKVAGGKIVESCEEKLRNNNFFEKLKNTKRAETNCNIELPYSKKGCQGECCGRALPILKAEMKGDLFEKPDISSRKIGKIKKSQNLKFAELLLQTIAYGEFVVEDEGIDALSQGLRRGDKLKIISFDGEGKMTTCQGDTALNIYFEELEGVRILKEVEAKQWTKIGTFSGLSGYVQGIGYQTYEACGSAEKYH